MIADHELDPMSKSLLAAPHSMTELKAQLAKTVITVVDILLWGFPRVQGVVFLLCTAAILYYHVKQVGAGRCPFPIPCYCPLVLPVRR